MEFSFPMNEIQNVPSKERIIPVNKRWKSYNCNKPDQENRKEKRESDRARISNNGM